MPLINIKIWPKSRRFFEVPARVEHFTIFGKLVFVGTLKLLNIDLIKSIILRNISNQKKDQTLSYKNNYSNAQYFISYLEFFENRKIHILVGIVHF